jgi:26S proteasome regulatory subunit N1
VETLEMLVQRLEDPDTGLHRPSLEALRVQIRDSTSSMASIPKALKFLRPHYASLAGIYERMQDAADKVRARLRAC